MDFQVEARAFNGLASKSIYSTFLTWTTMGQLIHSTFLKFPAIEHQCCRRWIHVVDRGVWVLIGSEYGSSYCRRRGLYRFDPTIYWFQTGVNSRFWPIESRCVQIDISNSKEATKKPRTSGEDNLFRFVFLSDSTSSVLKLSKLCTWSRQWTSPSPKMFRENELIMTTEACVVS